MYNRPSIFSNIPPVTKNLLIINVLIYFAVYVVRTSMNIDLQSMFALHIPMASDFQPYQLVTYMFLHSQTDLMHLFFNMFAVFMFGRVLEQVWGGKRFLTFYMVTGIGAALIHLITLYIDVMPVINSINGFMSDPSNDHLQMILNEHVHPYSLESQRSMQGFIESYNRIAKTDIPAALKLANEFLVEYEAGYLNAIQTVGASGAVFGILLAFGMLFPEARLMLLFPPIPIKAKYFVMIYGVIELFMGVANFSFDNVAHFAHLGGMLFGYFMIRYWKNRGIG